MPWRFIVTGRLTGLSISKFGWVWALKVHVPWVGRFGAQDHLHPVRKTNRKIFKTNSKNSNLFLCGWKFDVWDQLQISCHLEIWAALDKKDKSGQNSTWTVNIYIDPQFVFFSESFSDVQMTWNLEWVSCIKLSTTQFFWIFIVFVLFFS